MIPFNWFSQFKNNWIKKQEDKLSKEYENTKLALEAEFGSKITALEEYLTNIHKVLLEKQEKLEAIKLKVENEIKRYEVNEEEIVTKNSDKISRLKQELIVEENNLKDKYKQSVKNLETQIANTEHKLEMQKLKELEVEEIYKRVQDRKEELQKANEELKSQIRLIEAKARPDQVWISAFTAGFNKACDSIPVLKDNIEKVKDVIKSDAIDSTISNLESVIKRRIDDAGLVHLKTANDLLSKKEQFEKRLGQVKEEAEKTKYKSYIEILNWMTNGHILPKN